MSGPQHEEKVTQLSGVVEDNSGPTLEYLSEDLSQLLGLSRGMFDTLNEAVNEVKHLSAFLPSDATTLSLSEKDLPNGLDVRLRELNELAHRMSVIGYADAEQEEIISELEQPEQSELWSTFVIAQGKDKEDIQKHSAFRNRISVTTSTSETQTMVTYLHTRCIIYQTAPNLPPPHRAFKAVKQQSTTKSYDIQFYNSQSLSKLDLNIMPAQNMGLVFVAGPPVTHDGTQYDWSTNVLGPVMAMPKQVGVKIVVIARRRPDRRSSNIQRCMPSDDVRNQLRKLRVIALIEMDYSPEMGYEKTPLNAASYEELTRVMCAAPKAKSPKK